MCVSELSGLLKSVKGSGRMLTLTSRERLYFATKPPLLNHKSMEQNPAQTFKMLQLNY